MYSPILAPVVALVAWTLVMMLWMIVTRFAAMRRKGISLKGRVGSRSGSLEGVIEDEVNWKSHNHTHLHEHPTLFYAIALSLALMDFGGGINLYLAWAYVALRIAHSLVQVTVNIVMYRFLLWILSGFCLIALTVHAAASLIHHQT
jgi:hypothetical protein